MSDTGFCSVDTTSHADGCACDYCREVTKLAPKLARPYWVQLIGAPVDAVATRTLDALKQTRKDRLKDAKARHKRTQRLRTALAGGFVRTTRAVA